MAWIILNGCPLSLLQKKPVNSINIKTIIKKFS